MEMKPSFRTNLDMSALSTRNATTQLKKECLLLVPD